MAAILITKPIPDQIINEGAAYKPFNLKEFIQPQDPKNQLRFQAGLEDDRSLPQGLICTTDGILSGIPASGTQGNYVVVIAVKDSEGEELTTQFNFTINPIKTTDHQDFLKDL